VTSGWGHGYGFVIGKGNWENGRRGEWGKGVKHVGGENDGKAVESCGPGIEVGESAVTGPSVGLDKTIDVEPIDVVEKGSVL
jgi:hypothetical protein